MNLFYEEPEADRWLPFDKHPRRILRRLLRGEPHISGQQRVFLNLCAGLDRLGVHYRVNNYRHILSHPEEVACIIGKPHVLEKIEWRNPILFGASIYSHPCDNPELLDRYNIRQILVPGEWMRRMCEPSWGDKVSAWPVGIDTDHWDVRPGESKQVDFLLYDKVRWDHAEFDRTLIEPIRSQLRSRNLEFREIRYGHYEEEEFRQLLGQCRAMIFLCEHETQGIAYQQALASGVPILAWDRGGEWQDPAYFPHKVRFGPVSSVPYWDSRCGIRFEDTCNFPACLDEFLTRLQAGSFAPRSYILDNLTLEKCAEQYLRFYLSICKAVCQ